MTLTAVDIPVRHRVSEFDAPMPEWIVPREDQLRAVAEAVGHYERGVRLVLLDGPTGAGKTVIAELIRRELMTRAVYVCTTKTLQSQFLADFPYSKVLKGRANYTPLEPKSAKTTCGDCPGPRTCGMCDPVDQCPYQIAKARAFEAPVAVLNTAYFLREANYVGGFGEKRTKQGTSTRPAFVILDEADELESSLRGFVEFTSWSITKLRLLGMEPIKKGARFTTIAKWLLEYAAFVRGVVETDPVETAKNQSHADEAVNVAGQLAQMLEERAAAGEEEAENADVAPAPWIRDYDYEGHRNPAALILRAVLVNRYGVDKLWRHADRWLAMSATLISHDVFVDELGWDEEYAVVEVPMTFAVANRPIHLVPIGSMARKDLDETLPNMARAIANLASDAEYKGERILVHTVSYVLARKLKGLLDSLGTGRLVVTYENAFDRADALAKYSDVKGAILLAPSMDRGYDFKDDLARVVVIAKVPFGNLGDRQVSARLHLPGGDTWYRVQAVRSLVQMTGRGVRGPDDWADSFILDSQFMANTWKKSKGLFPAWWRDAVTTNYPKRKLMAQSP